MLAELRLRFRATGTEPDLQRAAEALSRAWLSDRLLDAVIAEDQDR